MEKSGIEEYAEIKMGNLNLEKELKRDKEPLKRVAVDQKNQ